MVKQISHLWKTLHNLQQKHGKTVNSNKKGKKINDQMGRWKLLKTCLQETKNEKKKKKKKRKETVEDYTKKPKKEPYLIYREQEISKNIWAPIHALVFIDLDIQKLHYRLRHLNITSLACAWPSTRHLEGERERELDNRIYREGRRRRHEVGVLVSQFIDMAPNNKYTLSIYLHNNSSQNIYLHKFAASISISLK